MAGVDDCIISKRLGRILEDGVLVFQLAPHRQPFFSFLAQVGFQGFPKKIYSV